MFVRASLLLCLAALPAAAQDLPTDRFRPALDARGLADVESAQVGQHLEGSAALWLGWDHQSLELVDHRAIARITGSLSLFDFVAVGVEAPAVITRGALGDVRLLAKLQALRAESHALDVAIAAGVTLPTAAADGFVGEHSFTFAPEILLGRSFGDLTMQAQGGVIARPVSTFGGRKFGSEARLRTGAGYRIPGWPVQLQGSASLALPMYASQLTLDLIGAEAMLASRVRLPSFSPHFMIELLGYAGLGLGSAVGTPTARAGLALSASFDGPPAPPPTPPTVAPTTAPRLDPFIDASVDPDAEEDAAPPEGEAPSDTDDTDVSGETDEGAVEVPEMAFDDDELANEDVFSQEIAFTPGTAELAASAAAQLDELAALWRALALDVSIAGGSDDDPSLTKRRIEAIGQALLDRGVTTAPLVPGPAHPLEPDRLLLVAKAQH